MRTAGIALLAACGRIGFDPVDACGGLAGGVHENTALAGTELVLVDEGQPGTFESAPCRNARSVRWTSFEPVTAQPYGKPLVVVSESGYPDGNLVADELVAVHHLDGALGDIADDARLEDATASAIDLIADQPPGKLRRVTGLFGEAVQMSADGALLWVPPGPSAQKLSFGGSFSYAVWLSTTQRIGTTQINGAWIFTKDVPNCAPDHFVLLRQGTPSFWTECDVLTSTADIADGRYHHLAVTRDVTDGTKVIYVDGRALATGLGSTNDLTNSEVFGLGGDQAAHTNLFAGKLDEVSIWRRALAGAEVAAVHARGAADVRYRVRACDEPACAGVPFVGPDGQPGTAYGELGNASGAPPVFPLDHLTGAYLQIEVTLEARGVSPRLLDLRITPGD